MTNHPNRGAAPPQSILSSRIASGLTQTAAAALIGYSLRAWQQWEGGQRKMRARLLDEFKRLAGVA